MLILTTGEKSILCLEDAVYPVADNYFNPQSIYSHCLEGDKMGFMKGYIPWNKGKSSWNKGLSLTDEHKQKLSEGHKGLTPWNKGKKGLMVAWNKGKPCSEETKLKLSRILSEVLKGKKKPPRSDSHKRNLSNALKGKISWKKGKPGLSGNKNPAWLGGISFEPYCHKFNDVLKEQIRNRDSRTCQLCGEKENGRKLDVHHIHYDKPNCEPDLISLCAKCHKIVNGNRDNYEEIFMNKLKNNMR